jgi:hypothetical protein
MPLLGEEQSMRHFLYYGAIGICVLVSAALTYSLLWSRPTEVATTLPAPAVHAGTSSYPVASETPEWRCDVSLENYKSLRVGMSYRRVRGIFGCEGTETYRNDGVGDNYINYKWDVPGGGDVSTSFKNDGLARMNWSAY